MDIVDLVISLIYSLLILAPTESQEEGKELFGSLEGVVLLNAKEAPKQEDRDNDKDVKSCGHKVIVESIQAYKIESGEYKDKISLKNVVVNPNVKKGNKYEGPSEFVLDQINCVYTPHILICKRNCKVELKNSDDVAHNVHIYATKNPSPNLNTASKSSTSISLKMNEIIKIACDIHPWMSAYVHVVDNPRYVCVTDKNGIFKISDIPAGKYKVAFWHEKLGKIDQEVEIKPNETTKITVTFNFDKTGS